MHRRRHSGRINRHHVIRSQDAKTLLKGSLWAFILQATSKASALITTLLCARYLGAEDFSILVSIQAFALLASSLWDAGISQFATREIAAHPHSTETIWRRGLIARLLLGIVPITVMVVATHLLKLTTNERWMAFTITGFSIPITAASNLLTAIMIGQFEFRKTAIGGAVGKLCYAISLPILLSIPTKHAMLTASVAYFMAELVTLLYLVRHRTRFTETTLRIGQEVRSSLSLIATSLPFAMSGIFILIYNRLDVVIVAARSGELQAGLYAPASRIQDALMLFPTIAVAALLPIASRRLVQDPNSSSLHTITTPMILALTFSIPTTIVATISAPTFTHISLGSDYSRSVVPIQILAISVPFSAISAPIMAHFVASNRPALASTMIFMGFVISLGGIYLAAPQYGANGAAVASALREPAIAFTGIGFLGIQHYGHNTNRQRCPNQ